MMNEHSDALGPVSGQREDRRILDALTLLVTARDGLMQQFGAYLVASRRLEDWLNTGAPIDAESDRKIAADVSNALAALTTLGTAAHSVAGVAARAVGLQLDANGTN